MGQIIRLINLPFLCPMLDRQRKKSVGRVLRGQQCVVEVRRYCVSRGQKGGGVQRCGSAVLSLVAGRMLL